MLRRLIPALCALMLAAAVTADPAVHAVTVRPEAVAGYWYPDDREQLGAWMDDLLKGESHADGVQGPVRAREHEK